MSDSKTPVAVSWSGGKDSALALWSLLGEAQFEVRALLVTVTAEYARISMHGVRTELLERQADALGLPVVRVEIPAECPHEIYAQRMAAALQAPPLDVVDHYAFGDLFLADVRAYREERLAAVGKQCLFPLWGSDTTELAHSFLAAGFRAVVTCVYSEQLDGAGQAPL